MAINLRVIDNFYTLVDIVLTAEKITFCVFTKLLEIILQISLRCGINALLVGVIT